MLSSIIAVIEGDDLSAQEDGLVRQLISQRDTETAGSIDKYLSSFQGESALKSKLMLLQAVRRAAPTRRHAGAGERPPGY